MGRVPRVPALLAHETVEASIRRKAVGAIGRLGPRRRRHLDRPNDPQRLARPLRATRERPTRRARPGFALRRRLLAMTTEHDLNPFEAKRLLAELLQQAQARPQPSPDYYDRSVTAEAFIREARA